jgi:hypothetical protein
MPEIVECGRTIAGDYVAFDIQWVGELPAGVSVLWEMVVTSDGDSESVRLGHQLDAAGEATQFVDAETTGRRVEVPADATLGEHEITVRFHSEVVGVAVEWPVWRAVLVVDGRQVSAKVANVG